MAMRRAVHRSLILSQGSHSVRWRRNWDGRERAKEKNEEEIQARKRECEGLAVLEVVFGFVVALLGEAGPFGLQSSGLDLGLVPIKKKQRIQSRCGFLQTHTHTHLDGWRRAANQTALNLGQSEGR